MVRRKCSASLAMRSFLEVSKGSTKVAQILIFLRRSVFCFQGRQELSLFSKSLFLAAYHQPNQVTCENQPDLHCCNNQLGHDLQRANLLSGLTCYRMWTSMFHGCKMLNHGLYKNLFSHFLSILKNTSVCFSTQEHEFNSQSIFCCHDRDEFQFHFLTFTQYIFPVCC